MRLPLTLAQMSGAARPVPSGRRRTLARPAETATLDGESASGGKRGNKQSLLGESGCKRGASLGDATGEEVKSVHVRLRPRCVWEASRKKPVRLFLCLS